MNLIFAAAQSSHPQTLEGPAATAVGAFIFLYLIASVVFTISYWIVFTKAGRKGWEALIPLYETWVRFELSGKPGWWLFPSIIPIVGLVLSVIACIELSKRFGRGTVFGIVMGLAPFIGYPILAFGHAKYHVDPGPAAKTGKHS